MWFSRLVIALCLVTPHGPRRPTILPPWPAPSLVDLIRLDTTKPPGNETRSAEYLKKLCKTEGIAAENHGDYPKRPGPSAGTDVVVARVSRQLSESPRSHRAALRAAATAGTGAPCNGESPRRTRRPRDGRFRASRFSCSRYSHRYRGV